MTSMMFVLLSSVAAGASDAETYAQAHQTTMKTGRPMVVMVTTDWCPPCQVMKRTIIPRVRQRGLLARVAFCVVNPDHDRELAEKITGGGPVPQLVMYRKTPHGWKYEKLIGGQSVESVEQFIEQGIADAGDAKADAPTAETAASPAPMPPKERPAKG